MITLITVFVPTYSVWYVILFQDLVWFTKSHKVLVISFCLFTNFIFDTKKRRAV